jgi:hypothetical protein
VTVATDMLHINGTGEVLPTQQVSLLCVTFHIRDKDHKLTATIANFYAN